MRVAILYNAVDQQDSIEDLDVLVQVEAVSESLTRLGHEHFSLACTLDLDAMMEKLRQSRPDVVFNLVESLRGDDSLIHLPPAVLDSLGLPYTGSSAEAIFITSHKLFAKERLFHAGLPTPAWIVQNGIAGENEKSDVVGPHPNPLPTNLRSVPGEGINKSRWIIKGVWEQGSRNMLDDAVFEGDLTEIQRRLRDRVKLTGRPAYAEEFVEGREFNMAMLAGPGGVEVLPAAEIDFSTFPAEKPRIVGYRAKWEADSFEYNNTPRIFKFSETDQSLLEQLNAIVRKCWALFMLHGWARVDFRVDQSGRPWVLEVNANPCLSPDAGFSAALRQSGISFDEAIRRIVDETIAFHKIHAGTEHK
jgi:D-alanine-D-alanine ligase